MELSLITNQPKQVLKEFILFRHYKKELFCFKNADDWVFLDWLRKQSANEAKPIEALRSSCDFDKDCFFLSSLICDVIRTSFATARFSINAQLFPAYSLNRPILFLHWQLDKFVLGHVRKFRQRKFIAAKKINKIIKKHRILSG